MKAGRLDRRISVLRKTITQNSYGEEVVAWATLYTVWASARPAASRESYKENQYQGAADTVFSVRWSETSKAVTVEDAISFDGRTYDITGVREIGRREGLELDAFARAETQVAPAIVSSAAAATLALGSVYWWLPMWRTING